MESVAALATSSSSSSKWPMRIFPSSRATVAGVAPASRTCLSISRASSRFCGWGSPCVITVDSSATTGVPKSSALVTSVEMTRLGFFNLSLNPMICEEINVVQRFFEVGKLGPLFDFGLAIVFDQHFCGDQFLAKRLQDFDGNQDRISFSRFFKHKFAPEFGFEDELLSVFLVIFAGRVLGFVVGDDHIVHEFDDLFQFIFLLCALDGRAFFSVFA